MFEFLESREESYNLLVDAFNFPPFVKELPLTLLGNPYHNSHHLRSVALNAYSIGTSEGLNYEQLRTAFLAGACHDLSYLGPDREPENIELAVKDFMHIADIAGLDIEHTRYGELLIRNTESTSVPKQFEEHHADMWVVHDADLAVWFNVSPEEASYLCNGIEKEMGLPTGLYSTKSFLNNHGMGTITGQNLLDDFNNQCLTTDRNALWIEHI